MSDLWLEQQQKNAQYDKTLGINQNLPVLQLAKKPAVPAPTQKAVVQPPPVAVDVPTTAQDPTATEQHIAQAAVPQWGAAQPQTNQPPGTVPAGYQVPQQSTPPAIAPNPVGGKATPPPDVQQATAQVNAQAPELSPGQKIAEIAKKTGRGIFEVIAAFGSGMAGKEYTGQKERLSREQTQALATQQQQAQSQLQTQQNMATLAVQKAEQDYMAKLEQIKEAHDLAMETARTSDERNLIDARYKGEAEQANLSRESAERIAQNQLQASQNMFKLGQNTGVTPMDAINKPWGNK
jgi:hypothetical protein